MKDRFVNKSCRYSIYWGDGEAELISPKKATDRADRTDEETEEKGYWRQSPEEPGGLDLWEAVTRDTAQEIPIYKCQHFAETRKLRKVKLK